MTISIQKYNLIVIDKNLETQKSITSFFVPKGYHVTNFSNASEAFKTFHKSKNTEWDIFLTDYNFSDMTHYDFTTKLKILSPKAKIILLSAPETTQPVLFSSVSDIHELIRKPIELQVLKSQIELTIGQIILEKDKESIEVNSKKNKLNSQNIIGNSPLFLCALSMARKVASLNTNVLINGETGTGKEVFAKYIHYNSSRKNGPFVAINCSAIPENLLESELFGHAKGSFTGAIDKKIGLFESAENGTLFLDEIGDLSLPLQAKLLRVLQEKVIRRVGENQDRPINCRIISATHKNLSNEVNQNNFREDLYFRLNVIPIIIPPLRERLEDIIPLAENFLNKYTLSNGLKAKFFAPSAIKFLLENYWRGNVRELENTLERAIVLSENNEISDTELTLTLTPLNIINSEKLIPVGNTFTYAYKNQLPSLEEIIQKYIEYAISENDGARDKTAKDIGIDRKTLYKRIKT
jgi:DNA-binding NtrC family response regulator